MQERECVCIVKSLPNSIVPEKLRLPERMKDSLGLGGSYTNQPAERDKKDRHFRPTHKGAKRKAARIKELN